MELVSRIPEATYAGKYGQLLCKARDACLARDEAQDEVAAKILDLLIDLTSEHTCSLIVRTLTKGVAK